MITLKHTHTHRQNPGEVKGVCMLKTGGKWQVAIGNEKKKV